MLIPMHCNIAFLGIIVIETIRLQNVNIAMIQIYPGKVFLNDQLMQVHTTYIASWYLFINK